MKKAIIILMLCISANLFAQINVKLETIFTINDEKTTQKEYMFKWLNNIITDSENNFYVYENNGTEIKKFSKEGKYITTISRAGSGPGELKSARLMHINRKNELFVYDIANGRDTYFDLSGRFIRSEKSLYTDHPYTYAYKYDKSSYLVLKSDHQNNIPHGNKIYICDDQSHKPITSFGHTSIFWKGDNVFENHMESSSAFKLAAANNKVYATKEYYDGKIYVFDKDKNWELKVVEGRQIKKPGYEIFETHSGSEIPKKGYAISFGTEWKGARRVFHIITNEKSMGLQIYKNKYLINFIVRYLGDKGCECGADVYKLDGTYLGYSKIESGNKVTIYDLVCCADSENNFYMIKNAGTIVKFRLLIY